MSPEREILGWKWFEASVIVILEYTLYRNLYKSPGIYMGQ